MERDGGFPMRRYRIALVAIVIFAFCPIVPMAFAVTLASVNGCKLHEGFTNPCVIAGSDWGSALYQMGISFWYLFITVPLGLALFVCCMIVLGVHRGSWPNRTNQP